jgi:hypothetical protein
LGPGYSLLFRRKRDTLDFQNFLCQSQSSGALAREVEDALFVVDESETSYELNLSTSDNPDQTVVISYIPKQLQVQAVNHARDLADARFNLQRRIPELYAEVIKADQSSSLWRNREEKQSMHIHRLPQH